MKTNEKISIRQAKTLYNWLNEISANYSVIIYIGSLEYLAESEQKEIVYEMIEQDLTPSDFMKTESGNYALKAECENISGIIWHKMEEVPENIVYDDVNNEYIHIKDAIYGYVEKYHGCFSIDETYYHYDNEIYHENSLQYHNLVIDHNGDILHLDDACYCEDIEEYVHCDYAYYSEIDECDYYHIENMPENKFIEED